MKSNRRRLLAVVASIALPVLLGVACSEQQRSLGEDCLKGDDCLSGTCFAQRCSATPPVANGSTTGGADGAADTASGNDGAVTDTSTDEASAPSDASLDDVVRDTGGDE